MGNAETDKTLLTEVPPAQQPNATGLHNVAGFTLIELAIASMIMMMVSAGVGMLVYNAFASSTADARRVNDISEAQKISAGIQQLLSDATCESAGANSVGNGVGWAIPVQWDNTCIGPPVDVIAGASNGANLYFFAPLSVPVNIGTAPPAVTYTEYQASLDAATHLVNGAAVHYLTLTNLDNGAITYLGDFVNTVAFEYFQWNAAPNAVNQCANNPQGTPDVGGVPTAAVSMRLTLTEASNDTSATGYNTCIFLPGAAL